jgi:PilZ domain
MASCTAPPSDASTGRRRHSRLRVCLTARLITLGGTLPITLLNLSFTGARISLGTASVQRGASAVLTWSGFEAFCKVAWVQGGHCGLDFDEPLRPDMLIATRDLADVTPGVDANRVAARDWAVGRVSRL